MIVPNVLLTAYAGLLPALEYVHRTTHEVLSNFAFLNSFPTYGRIKSVESTAEKIETGRYSTILDLDDLVAFTIIIPKRADEGIVTNFVGSHFNVLRMRERSTIENAPDVFRFDFTRVFCRLDLRGVPDVDTRVVSIIIEVQVRTAFEHAWAVATHDEAYKSDTVDWRRLRVAAQLKAIIENLDSVVTAFDAVADATATSPWPRLNDQILIQRRFQALFEREQLPRTLMPLDMSRFCDNVVSLIRSIRPTVQVADCIEYFETQLTLGALDPLPTSLSLYQLFIGSLCEAEQIPLNHVRPCHVTEEMVTIFPKTRDSHLSSNTDHNGVHNLSGRALWPRLSGPTADLH